MGKKKKGGKKGKKKKGGNVGPPAYILRDNYAKACKEIGEQPNDEIHQEIDRFASESMAYTQLCFGDRDLGPAGVRAIAEAIIGEGEFMEGGTYLALTNLQLWHANVLDDGLVWISRMLKKCTMKEFQLGVLDLMDNGIGVRGMTHLGDALGANGNTSLKTVALDYNKSISDTGTIALCGGLLVNTTLKKLSLQYCDIGPTGARSLSQALSIPSCGLEKLLLAGNHIGSKGIRHLALALKRNKKLTLLDVSNNEIGGYPPEEDDLECLTLLMKSLEANTTLTTLNLEMNAIGQLGAETLLPGMSENKTITSMTVDIDLPDVLFDALTRAGGGGKKKGKKKKKKKK